MGLKVMRRTLLFFMLIVMSITLSGCKELLDGIANFIDGVVKTVEKVFGTVSKVVRGVTGALKAGKDAINTVKEAVSKKTSSSSSSKSSSKSSSGTKGRIIEAPDKDVDEDEGKAADSEKSSTPTKSESDESESAAEETNEEEENEEAVDTTSFKQEIELAKSNVDKKMQDLNSIIQQELPKETKEQVKDLYKKFENLKNTLDKIEKEAKVADTQTELDRIKSEFEKAEGYYSLLVNTVKTILTAAKTAEKVSSKVIDNIKNWVNVFDKNKSSSKSDSTTKDDEENESDSQNEEEDTQEADTNEKNDSNHFAEACKPLLDMIKSTIEENKSTLEPKLIDELNKMANRVKELSKLNVRWPERIRSESDLPKEYKELRSLSSRFAEIVAKTKLCGDDIVRAAVYYNLDHKEKIDINYITKEDIKKLVEQGYLKKAPEYWDELHQTTIKGAKSIE